MSIERIPTRSDGQVIDESWFNTIIRSLVDYFVPRDTNGEAADFAGSLGTSSLRWLKAFISEGHWSVGDFKYHHSYNGTVDAGEGWMLCDGRTISQANYDTEHGSGHWATYVGSSLIDGKKLPNLTSKYLVGKASTTQDGSGTITPVGNTSHQVNLAHNQKVYSVVNSVTSSDTVYDSSGNPVTITQQAGKTGVGNYQLSATEQAFLPTTLMYGDSQLSATQSVQPDSIEVQIYMRII